MYFQLDRTKDADEALNKLQSDQGLKIQLKAVLNALGKLQIDPRHPSLRSSKLHGHSYNGKDIWHSYAQNETPGAYRIWWIYNTPKPTKECRKPIPCILIINIGNHDHYKQ
jgi:hypothetical protein